MTEKLKASNVLKTNVELKTQKQYSHLIVLTYMNSYWYYF